MAEKSFYAELGNLFDEVARARAGRLKAAEANTETGSIGGATANPIKNVDDGTQAATEGARSAENEKLVKDRVPGSVDAAPHGSSTQADVQPNIGVEQSQTGENPPAVRGGREDPGTDSKATVDDGKKYASMSFDQLYDLSGQFADKITAKIAAHVGVTPAVKAAAAACKDMPAPAGARVVGPETSNKRMPPAKDDKAKMAAVKEAQDKLAAETVASAYNDGQRAAVQVVDFLRSYHANREKAAAARNAPAPRPVSSRWSWLNSKKAAEEGESASGENHDDQPKPSEGGGGGPPPADPPGGGEGGGGGGEGGGAEAEAEQVIQALLEQGIQPEQILQLIQGAVGGGGGGGAPPGMPPDAGGGMPPDTGGGMPPDAGGAPPGMPPGAPPGSPPGMPPGMPPGGGMEVQAALSPAVVRGLTKLAHDVDRLVKKSGGKPRYRGAKSAEEARLRDRIKGCFNDLLSRR